MGVGRHVIYIDPHGKERHALVTNEFGTTSINCVYVNDDPNQQDSYGQKIERATSVPHASRQEARGNKWRELTEQGTER